MKLLLIPLLLSTGFLPVHVQQNQHANNLNLLQRDVSEKELMALLRRGIDIMASERCAEDRKKILESESEEMALLYVTFSPILGANSSFCMTEGLSELIKKIEKAAGLQMRPHLGCAPRLLGKVVLNSVRLQKGTIMLMVDKARRDDKTFGLDLFVSKPTELKCTPTGMADKKEVMPLLKRGIEIMAGEECAADRKKILEFGNEKDALDYVMFFSEFCLRGDVRQLKEKIDEAEKSKAGLDAASLLLSIVVLNSVRLQESAMMLMVYEERRRDRSLRTMLSETPPPPPLLD
jgi:hypothetical protein